MGVADGLALIMGVGLVTGEDVIATAESVTRIMLIVNSLLIVAYLVNANYQSATAELSVKELVRGHVAWVFWLGIVVLGIIVPFVISVGQLLHRPGGRHRTAGLRDHLPHDRGLLAEVRRAQGRHLPAPPSQSPRLLERRHVLRRH